MNAAPIIAALREAEDVTIVGSDDGGSDSNEMIGGVVRGWR
jgi:hypothetical protein